MLKRKSKRVLSIVLAVAMIVGLFPIAAFADEGTTPAEAKTIRVDGTATTLASAAQQANDGDTIQLTNDIKLQTGVDFEDTVTLDLNGHTIADKNWTSGDYLVSVKRGGELTIEDSSTDQTGAITASSSNEKLYAAVKITLTGEDEATTPANLIVNGGTLTGYYYGISGNGKRHNTNIEINGGKIVGTNGAGIYHPQDGTLTINGGEIIGKDTAVEIRSGKLNISGGSLTANADTYTEKANNNGTTVSGAALAISQHTTQKPIAVTITGGTFKGARAVSETNVQNDDSTKDVTLIISNGTFDGKISSADCTDFITGGIFIHPGDDIAAYMAPGNTLDSNGNVTPSADAVASVDGVGYISLQDAITAAKDGDTVTVIGDATAEFVDIRDKALTINGSDGAKVSAITVINNTAEKKNVTINNLTFVGASKENNLDTNPSALYLQKVGTATIKGCTFDLAGEVTGTTVAITSGSTNNVIVEDCTIDGYTIAGYHNPGCANVTYTDNTIKNAPSGIAFVATDNVVVKNNTFENSNGIRLEPGWTPPVDTCDQATFTGNKIISLSSDASSQYAIRATNSNGANGFSGENLVIDHNYWGSANPDFDSIIKVADGATFTVDPEPYYTAPTMEAEDLNTYEPPYTGKYSYEIFTKVGENGTISVDRYATEGDDVTITVSPDEAYLLDELTVTAGGKEVEVKDNGDGTYTFKMPSADAKIVVTFAEDPDWEPEPEEPAMPFTDVNEGDWFYDVVLYAYDNGLMTGVSATEFAPNQTTTRGMIVSMLARLEGVTSAESAGFTDVADNDWYATAVNWAASVGVVNGYEDNTFRPNAPITREQMAAILYNYADYKGYDVSARADLSDYADAASISSWAEDVLAWANAEGLINGMTATTIDPQGATTRAQTAAMFERFLTAHAE